VPSLNNNPWIVAVLGLVPRLLAYHNITGLPKQLVYHPWSNDHDWSELGYVSQAKYSTGSHMPRP